MQGPTPNEKVLWLNIPVDDVLGMHKLDPRDELNGSHADRLEAKLAAAHVKQVLETRAQQLHHQTIILAARAVMKHLWETHLLPHELIESIPVT